jgi:hypothetical protein
MICMWQINFNYFITNSCRDAGECGRRVCRAGELGLDVVCLDVVLAAAEVGAGGRDPHLDAAGQVVPAVRHALRDHWEVRLAVRGTHSCHTRGGDTKLVLVLLHKSGKDRCVNL